MKLQCLGNNLNFISPSSSYSVFFCPLSEWYVLSNFSSFISYMLHRKKSLGSKKYGFQRMQHVVVLDSVLVWNFSQGKIKSSKQGRKLFCPQSHRGFNDSFFELAVSKIPNLFVFLINISSFTRAMQKTSSQTKSLIR